MIDFKIVKTAARGRWPEILVALGIPHGALTGKHSPCPGCGGRDRFRYLKDEHGGWICGQGGSPTGGDGFDLLVHVHGWSKRRVLETVADHFGIQPDTNPQAREKARERVMQSKREDYEEALLHELDVLRLAVSRRVVDRRLATDRGYANVVPWFRPIPGDHWERETLAARRVRVLISKLYTNAATERKA
jgi:phage/plasmid primase-like uncharacterized protein